MRTLLAMSLVLVTSCKSQKVLEVETEIAAAKSRVAALEKKRQELTADLKRLQVERKTFGQQADEAALAKERLSAASYALANKPLPDGIQLDEALRAKSPTLGKLAAEIVQRQLPCVDESETTSDSDEADGCSPPPLADACEGVSETYPQSFAWNCRTLPANGKVPALALCLSKAELAASDYPPTVPNSHLEGDVVRMAYEKKGRLFVADWPPPSTSLYEPENYAELATCHAENENAQCVRSCDERWGKLGGCGDWAATVTKEKVATRTAKKSRTSSAPRVKPLNVPSGKHRKRATSSRTRNASRPAALPRPRRRPSVTSHSNTRARPRLASSSSR